MPETASLARRTATRWSLWFGGQIVHPSGGSPLRTGGALERTHGNGRRRAGLAADRRSGDPTLGRLRCDSRLG